MALVSNKFLGALCVKLGFHRHLRINSPSVMYHIQDYVAEITEAERDSNGIRDYWTMTKNPPKVPTKFNTTEGLANSSCSAYPTLSKPI